MDDSGAQFISVGDCVRALPWKIQLKIEMPFFSFCLSIMTCSLVVVVDDDVVVIAVVFILLSGSQGER